jgi:hypothetical protein
MMFYNVRKTYTTASGSAILSQATITTSTLQASCLFEVSFLARFGIGDKSFD